MVAERSYMMLSFTLQSCVI